MDVLVHPDTTSQVRGTLRSERNRNDGIVPTTDQKVGGSTPSERADHTSLHAAMAASAAAFTARFVPLARFFR